MEQQTDRLGTPARGETSLRHRFLPTRAGVIELLVLFALLLLIERLAMAPGEFAKLQPHPYWLPVILLSLQYGTADGVLAAAVAILISVVVGWPSQGVGEDFYRYIIRVWAVPIGWIMTSIVIGEVRARQRSQLTELKTALDTSREQASDITSHCYKLEEKIQRLERDFATTENYSVDSLAAALHDLHRGDAVSWQATIARVHGGLIGAGVLTVVLKSDQAFVTIAQASAGAGQASPLGNTLAHAPHAELLRLLEALTGGGSALNADRPDDARTLDGLAALAVPFGEPVPRVAGLRPRLAGALLLDGIAPDKLSIDTEHRLELLAREIGQALAARGSEDLVEGAGESNWIVPRDAVVSDSADEAGTDPQPPRRIGVIARFGRA